MHSIICDMCISVLENEIKRNYMERCRECGKKTLLVTLLLRNERMHCLRMHSNKVSWFINLHTVYSNTATICFQMHIENGTKGNLDWIREQMTDTEQKLKGYPLMNKRYLDTLLKGTDALSSGQSLAVYKLLMFSPSLLCCAYVFL